jgi:hypothetical protein
MTTNTSFSESTSTIDDMLSQPQVFEQMYNNYVDLLILEKNDPSTSTDATDILNSLNTYISQINGSTVGTLEFNLKQGAILIDGVEKLINLINDFNQLSAFLLSTAQQYIIISQHLKEFTQVNKTVSETGYTRMDCTEDFLDAIKSTLENGVHIQPFHNNNYGLCVSSPISSQYRKIGNVDIDFDKSVPYVYPLFGCRPCQGDNVPSCDWSLRKVWWYVRKRVKIFGRRRTIHIRVSGMVPGFPRKCAGQLISDRWEIPRIAFRYGSINADSTVYGTQSWGSIGGDFYFTTEGLNQKSFYDNLKASTIKKINNYSNIDTNQLNGADFINFFKDFAKNVQLNAEEMENLTTVLVKELKFDGMVITMLDIGFLIPLKLKFEINGGTIIDSPKIPFMIPKTNMLEWNDGRNVLVIRPSEGFTTPLLTPIFSIQIFGIPGLIKMVDDFLAGISGKMFVNFRYIPFSDFEIKAIREFNAILKELDISSVPAFGFILICGIYIGYCVNQPKYPLFYRVVFKIDLNPANLAETLIDVTTTLSKLIAEVDKKLEKSIGDNHLGGTRNIILNKILGPLHNLMDNIIPQKLDDLKRSVEKNLDDDKFVHIYEINIPIEIPITINLLSPSTLATNSNPPKPINTHNDDANNLSFTSNF